MKYLFRPIWFLLICIWTSMEAFYLIIYNIFVVMWDLSIKYTSDWQEYTLEEKDYMQRHYPVGYDKNPWETIVRRYTLGTYKNFKK